MFMLICGRVHWTLTLTSSYLKTFAFDRPHEYDKSPFLKIYSLESVFKNLRVCGRKRRLLVVGRCTNGEKHGTGYAVESVQMFRLALSSHIYFFAFQDTNRDTLVSLRSETRAVATRVSERK